MARGAIAKTAVEKKLATAFGSDYIGEYDKKYYVWADDGGERVQIALSMTCPKVMVAEVAQINSEGGIDFTESDAFVVAPSGFEPVTFTQEEEDTISALIEKLNL